jgi:hypothetical protein
MSIYAKELVLPDNEYIKEVTKKNQIVLHHTAGSSNPTYVVDGWDVDPARIATHNVVGGISTNGNSEWDGKIIKAIDSRYFAYHLGVKGKEDPTRKPQGYYDMKSVAIEVCCYGELTFRLGKYYNYLNKVVPGSQVIDLGKEFRGHRYYQSYTTAQIEALRVLILYHCENENIVLDKGRVFTWDDFNYDIKRFGEKAIAFHVNYREDGKNDLYPHPKLIAMLNELHR